MPKSPGRDPVYFSVVVLLVAVSVGFFALGPSGPTEMLHIRPVTVVLTLFVALAFTFRAREGGQPWSALIGVLVVLVVGVQLILFIIGIRLPPVAANEQVIAQTFAAGMFCVGAALIIDSWLPAHWGRHLLFGMLGAIVAGIGALGLFGLAVNAMNPLDYGPLRGMRLPSASILLLCGISLLSGARLSVFAGDASAPHRHGEEDIRDRTGLAAGLVMLVVALGTMALTWREAQNHVTEQTNDAVQASLTRVGAAIQANALGTTALLDGLLGLFAASVEVERKEWFDYLENVRLGERYPELIAVGYVREVRQPLDDGEGLIAHDVEGRLQSIWPNMRSDVHYPIVYIAPDNEITERLIGHDVAIDQRHRAAIDAARATRAVAMSATIDFSAYGDTAGRRGYVLVAPINDDATVADRPGNGYVYAAIDIDRVLARSRITGDNPASRLRIIDESASVDSERVFADADFDRNTDFRSVELALAGRHWTVQAQSRPGDTEALQSDVPEFVLLGGSLCALVLFAITWILAGHRARAMHLAAAMTSELRKSERAHQAITDTAIAGIITSDSDGSILYMNRAAAMIFGVQAEDMIGKSLTGMMPQRFRHGHQVGLARVRDGGPRHVIGNTIEMSGLRADGVEFPIEILLSCWNSEGQIFFTGFVRDITDRRNAQLELERKTRELERSNADLEQFAYVASHDLQEPLRMVASYVQLLSRRYRGQLDADADEFIAFAVDGATRMQRLIQDLLGYARVGRSGKLPVPTHVGHCAETAVAHLQGGIVESGARVSVVADFEVMVEPSQLTQLFQNLIVNALKFRERIAPEIDISATREGEFWHMRVRDNGIGIEPQHRERVFSIFQRLHTRAEYPGTGIGLAICRKIVEGGGGRIWVDSEPGQGSVFHFTLPVMKEPQ